MPIALSGVGGTILIQAEALFQWAPEGWNLDTRENTFCSRECRVKHDYSPSGAW